MVKVINSKFSSDDIKKELRRVNYNSRYMKLLINSFYTLIIIFAISALVVTLLMPILEIKGDSMSPLYSNGDVAVSMKFNRINRGDIISFYYGNKILIKRVIAVPGDWITIDDKNQVFVNGSKLNEPYVKQTSYDIGDIKYPYQVVADAYFVLSDDRDDNIDSRFTQIGCVKKSDIIGRVLFRIWQSK